jgi:hypothetical protein
MRGVTAAGGTQQILAMRLRERLHDDRMDHRDHLHR